MPVELSKFHQNRALEGEKQFPLFPNSSLKMQPRVFSLEEGNDSTIKGQAQARVLPLNIIKFLLLFLGLGLVFSFFSMYTTRYMGTQNALPSVHSGFLPCIKESNNFERWIRPPSSLMHSMTDEELFWRASFVPQLKKYPFKIVPKVAFMFLTKGPLPLSLLWEEFLKGHEGLYSIYVHSLPSYHADFPPTSVFYRRQIPSKVCSFLSLLLQLMVLRILYEN